MGVGNIGPSGFMGGLCWWEEQSPPQPFFHEAVQSRLQERIIFLVPKLQLGNAVPEAPASH